MAHLACIDLPLLALQVLQRQEPALGGRAAAVVAAGRAQALVLQVNAHAWRRGVRPGLRQAAALSLVGDLQTRTVPDEAVRAAVTQLTQLLRKFSDHVEPGPDEPGSFWLSARGLRRLYGHPRAWAEALHAALHAAGWQAAVVAGFGHFTTQVIAQGVSSSPGAEPGAREATVPRLPVHVFTDPACEREAAARVPLERCGLTVDELEALTQLGLRCLGDVLRLPAEGLLQRFGPRLYRLHRLATGTLQDPLQPQAERLPVRDWIFFESPEDNTERLLFRVKARLPFLLTPLAARREALHTLRLELALDDHTRQAIAVQPAQPTRQERLILELLRLRLERGPEPLSSPPASLLSPKGKGEGSTTPSGEGARRHAIPPLPLGEGAGGRGHPAGTAEKVARKGPAWLTAGIVEIMLEAEGRPRELEQPVLLGQTARRDLAAANRALAQLRAEFGEQAVVRAVPKPGHLPEARFAWEPLQRLEAEPPVLRPRVPRKPTAVERQHGSASGKQTLGASSKLPAPAQPAGASGKPAGLVRRMLTKPLPLPGWPRDATRWTQGRSPDADGLLALHGPYVISGGWWQHEQQRDYYLAETAGGEVQWLYHDRRRGRWFCQGWVE